MNVDQVYQLQRDDAFAKQFSAKEYSTFVAMPFTNRNGYPRPVISFHAVARLSSNTLDLLAGASVPASGVGEFQTLIGS